MYEYWERFKGWESLIASRAVILAADNSCRIVRSRVRGCTSCRPSGTYRSIQLRSTAPAQDQRTSVPHSIISHDITNQIYCAFRAPSVVLPDT